MDRVRIDPEEKVTRLTVALACALALTACSSGGPVRAGGSTPPPLPTPSSSSPSPSATKRLGRPADLATGLSVPWAIAFLPDGNALVTERDSARLLRVTPGGKVSTVGKVPGVSPSGEGGLLGVAVSPGFARDRWVYLYYSAASDNRIVRFQYRGRGVDGVQTLVKGIPRGAIHNGGRLAFGPDRMLYASTGETGRGGLAQTRSTFAGKILRITPDGDPAPGNPFGTRVWTYGHRNVQGLAWDPDGRMFATEFGQDRFDEINRIQKGRNYGWPVVEGAGNGRFTRPLLTWSTDEASPSGLAYAGGSLWAAALRGERLWQVPVSEDGEVGRPKAHFTGRYGRLRAAVAAPDGSLWVITNNRDGRGSPRSGDDRILRIPLR
jgi:glucose/arabinose dehydrogenase